MSEALSMSPTIGKLADALSKAQASMQNADKDRVNPFFGRSYATLSSVWEACREALSANGLSVMQPVTSQGKAVTVTTLLAHASGEWVRADLTVDAKDASAQSVGSATTYGRRYGLSAMVGVAQEEDDDGNAASHGQGATSPARPAKLTERNVKIQTKPATNGQATREDVDRDNLDVDRMEMLAHLKASESLSDLVDQRPAIIDLKKRLKEAGMQAGLDELTRVCKERHEALSGKPAIPPAREREAGEEG